MFHKKASGIFFLLATAFTILSLLQAHHANAVPSPHAMNTRHIVGYSGGGGGGGNLVYHGGPVMNGTAHVYIIFWEPKGSYVSPTYNQLILRFFGDIGLSGLYANNVQYPDGQGHFPQKSVLSGSWVDTAQYPSNPTIYDSDIQNEVTHAQQIKHWTSTATNLFFVFTAKGENVCFNGGPCSFTNFCGFHFFFNSIFTFYASIPYEGTDLAHCGTFYSPNSDIDADSAINVASHELMESVTDPTTGAWNDSLSQEIGDKCAWIFGGVGRDGSDIHIHGHPYILQEEWDNKASACVMKGP